MLSGISHVHAGFYRRHKVTKITEKLGHIKEISVDQYDFPTLIR